MNKSNTTAMTKAFFAILSFLLIVSCHSSQKASTLLQKTNSTQEKFWQSLQGLCGNAYKGTVVSAPANDTTFKDKILLMHVRSCEPTVIRIPFFVGENRSRTWVFTKTEKVLSLKHDHRHKDGTADSITQYGGQTANSGMETLQMFPADQETTNLLPAAATNVWWVEVVPGKYFTYNLRRIGTDRLFSIRFDLSAPVDKPEGPWGWKD
jgi:hypothetical protein